MDRQAKPPAPPSLQTLALQGRWGRRFRLPGRPEANFHTFQDGPCLIWAALESIHGDLPMHANWSGVFPALTTQFKRDQSLDLEATAEHLDRMIRSGIHG